MGTYVTTIENLPQGLGYYFFLIGDFSNDTLINNFFRKEFSVIASRIGKNATILGKHEGAKSRQN